MNAKELARVRRLVGSGAARAIREAAGLSLAEVAADVRVDRSTIHRWESGSRKPTGSAAGRYLSLLEELQR